MVVPGEDRQTKSHWSLWTQGFQRDGAHHQDLRPHPALERVIAGAYRQKTCGKIDQLN